MVRSYRSSSMRASRKDFKVYASKASCLVLTQSERQDFAQCCLILLKAEQKIKEQATATKAKNADLSDIGNHKLKGSQNREPLSLTMFLISQKHCFSFYNYFLRNSAIIFSAA